MVAATMRPDAAVPTGTSGLNLSLRKARRSAGTWVMIGVPILLVGLFAWALRPRTEVPQVRGLFPGPAHFHSEVHDTVLDRATLPAVRFLAGLLARLRVLQQGSVQVYVLYVFLALIGLLLWR